MCFWRKCYEGKYPETKIYFDKSMYATKEWLNNSGKLKEKAKNEK
jgi:hypothetical protein